ncbi:MAG: erythromycin esterase family protein [Bacteroidota bacterium]
MKKLIICIFTFINSFIFSQELIYKELLPPNAKELSDLTFLDKELQNVSVVMLGEMTHDFGNIFEIKTRIIKYLHQNLGFNTIAMEAPIYDIWKLNQNGYNSEGFNKNIFEVWSKSEEFQELVKYIEKNKIKVIGFDSQFNYEISQSIDDFLSHLNFVKYKLKVDEDDFGIQLDNVLELSTYDVNVIAHINFINEVDKIIKHFQELPQNDENYYWIQFSKSIKACANDAFFSKNIKTAYYGDQDYNYRDKQMADNLLSYFDRFPNEKVICWADNIHIVNDMSSVNEPIIKDFISMGTYIKTALKDKVYSIATLHSNDSIKTPYGFYPVSIEENSLEDYLKKNIKPVAFFKANQEFLRKEKKSRLLHYSNFDNLKHNQLFDAYVYLNKATLSTYSKSQMIDTLQNNQTKDLEKIRIDESMPNYKNNTLLKSNTYQVVNTLTLEPISFASIYFEKEKVFIESDENGFFKINSKQKLSSKSIATVTSLGYQKQKILMSQIDLKIFLTPKDNLLDEVIVTANLSLKKILKKTIKNLRTNHPETAFNFHRHSKISFHVNEKPFYEYELVNKEFGQGYFSPYTNTNLVEHIKWHHKPSHDYLIKMKPNFSFRENAIQYGGIFNKRKRKKFEFNLEESISFEGYEVYVVSFVCKKDNWSYTNRNYSTHYSGKFYINKEDFAILKIEENWESKLNQVEIMKHFKDIKKYHDSKELNIKESQSNEYLKVINKKYYASQFNKLDTKHLLKNDGTIDTSVFEYQSKTFNFSFENIEEIEHKFTWAQRLIDIKEVEDFWREFKSISKI